MEARLIISYSGHTTSFVLDPGQKTVIGRHPNCNLRFDDAKLSGKHCTIEIQGDYFFVVDKQSTNGTYVNNTRVRVRQLYNADIIRCGNVAFRFELIEEDSDLNITAVDMEPDETVLDIANKSNNSKHKPQKADKQIGHYRILHKIGQGGIGEVFLAKPMMSLGTVVAIKLLTPVSQKNETLVERFMREAQACIDLDHPRIIKVFELGEHEGRPFFVMEYVEGASLFKFIRQHGPLSALNALKIGGHITHALAYAHGHNIIHRDLKPSNVLVEEGSHHVKLIDLGLAKMLEQSRLTLTHHVVGTPRYMAPEQMLNPATIDVQADIYSLGATLYYAVTGMAPYGEIITAQKSTLIRHIYSRSPVPISELVDIHPLLVNIINKAMAKHKQQRYQSAMEMFEAIHGAVKIVARDLHHCN